MTWARVAAETQLEHNFASLVPSDHWAQVDIWIPTLFPCPPDPELPGLGSLPYFLYQPGIQDGISALSGTSPIPNWEWQSFHGSSASGPSTGTTYTVGYHVHGSTVDFYVDGVLVITDTPSFFSAYIHLVLNAFAPTCCCQVVYYTNVLVGTSQGAGDILADDFSGGFSPNWYVTAPTGPPVASLVSAPSAAPCPTVNMPLRAQPGDTITISGSGFTPSVPVELSWEGVSGWTPVDGILTVTNGAGTFSATIKVPFGLGTNTNPFGNPSTDAVYVVDAAGLVGCAQFSICGARNADGITAQVDSDGFNTDLPNPVVGVGGTVGASRNNEILDYVFHAGNHWVLWADPSAIDNAGTFPPPPNHTMTATCISPDGSSVVDYAIDTDYQWIFSAGNVNDPGLGADDIRCPPGSQRRPVWSQQFFFSSWAKPIYDAHFESDGTTLWVGVVTRETVPYPWIDNRDSVLAASGPGNPGSANQFAPLASLTAGFTVFATDAAHGYFRFNTQTDGAINIYKASAIPVTDAGEEDSGHWSPPCVAMFAFNGSAFSRIGTIPALYCPGKTNGQSYAHSGLIGVPQVQNPAPRGSLFSRVALAASPNNPGVCHVVWSEGGDWGRQGDGGICTGSLYVWDGGPANRSYRVNYTTWSPSAKLTDQDISESHIDRTSWNFTWSWDDYPSEFLTGYTWPPPEQFGGLVVFDLRCDNANVGGGNVLLFVAPSSLINLPFEPEFGQASPDPGGHTWDDYSMIYCDTLKVYDITGGTPVLKQTITPDLLPNEAEADWAYPPNPATNQSDATQPTKASDCLYAGTLPPFDPNNGKALSDISPVDKAFGISLVYDDPLLGGTPVYLVHVPWARRMIDETTTGAIFGNFPLRGFYRVPADMSGPFDFLDGERQPQFSILRSSANPLSPDQFSSGDFFSDPGNIWVPSGVGPRTVGGGANGPWYDRICKNQWLQIPNAFTPGDFSDVPIVEVGEAACPGFNYDPRSDSISFVAPVASGSLFAITRFFICRGCAKCRCGQGVHIARRF